LIGFFKKTVDKDVAIAIELLANKIR